MDVVRTSLSSWLLLFAAAGCGGKTIPAEVGQIQAEGYRCDAVTPEWGSLEIPPSKGGPPLEASLIGPTASERVICELAGPDTSVLLICHRDPWIDPSRGLRVDLEVAGDQVVGTFHASFPEGIAVFNVPCVPPK